MSMFTTSLPRLAASAALVISLALAGCASQPTPSASPSGPTESSTLTVITHDSFAISDEAKGRFEKQTGYDVTFVASGDAGTIVNQLILTKDSPMGDVVFGIDNTFAARATTAGVLAPYKSPALPASASSLAADDSHTLTPIDYGDVCINADDQWFAAHGLAVPATLDDLAKPEYKDLLVLPNPATSSPGLVLVAATVGAFGDPGYLDYWSKLKANGVKIVKGWTEAYTVEFSGSSGKGSRPLVLSYASSPASEVGEDGTARTSTLPQTCFRQTEYAGVIAGAANEVGARKFIDFMLSDETQSEIPTSMWMSPVDPDATLPPEWAKYTSVVTDPIQVPADDIAKNRDAWIKAWTQTVIG